MADFLKLLQERTDILLGLAVVATLLLTGGLGVALAVGSYVLDREKRRVSGPEVGPAAGVSLSGREARRAVMPHRTAGPGAAVFTLVILAVGLLAGLFVRLMPFGAAREAGQVDTLFNTMFGIAAAIFLLVEGVLLYAAIRFRRKAGDETDGLPLHGSFRLEIAWTVIPALIVIWLGAVSFQTLQQIRAPGPQAMVVEVTARQFQFEFYYPDLDRTTADLYVPVNTPIHLKITSADVLHAFWVPAFRVKQDAIPQAETEAYFTASEIGTYPVRCAELCGAGHGRMGLINTVVVQTESEFRTWAKGAAAVVSDPAALFAQYGCNACHALAAVGADGQVGPSLDGIGTTASARRPGISAEDYLRESIVLPNAYIVEGFQPNIMPQDFGERLSQADVDALVNLLLEQQ